MTVKCNVPGKKRKELAQEIGRWLGCNIEYLGAPSFAYKVGDIHIDREGTLTIGIKHKSEVVDRLLQHLYDENFDFEIPTEEEPTGLTIKIPLDKVKVGNLTAILDAKATLIKTALGIQNIQIFVDTDNVNFPWFAELPIADEVKAYTHFITALCEMSIKQKRINAQAKETENEKYAFRCFLLRLGFIGAEYKTERKILLKNFTGSSAYKNGMRPTESEVSENA